MKTLYFLVVISVLQFFVPLTQAQTDHSGHTMDHSTDAMDHTGQSMDHSGHTMDHSQHQTQPAYTAPAQKGELANLPQMPASGAARENGYDGRYLMESTSVNDSLQQLCAKASRGLVMLDDKTWQKCGGKPRGAAMGPEKAAPMDHSQHQMH